MINIQNKIDEIENLSVKNINEKKISLENFIIRYKKEKNTNIKLQILYLIHYTINRYNELKYFYKFVIDYNKSNTKIAEFFS